MKKVKQTFEELTVGHTFVYVKKEDKLPAGTFFWCAFCGGRGRVAHTVQRDDGLEMKIGTTCLKRVGLSAPEEPQVEKKPKLKPAPVVEEAPVSTEQPKAEVPAVEAPPVKEADLSDEALDAFFAEEEKK